LRSKHFATAENQKRKGNKMKTTELELDRKVVSAREWEAVRQQLLVKEKELSRARDALSAERRRMPLLAVEKEYEFDGPQGGASLLDLFEGRRQLIVYRAFFEPGVVGWPEHACVGCSMVADQVAHPAHLNARDTTLAFASRAPQKDIERLKARMGWQFIPWYTITDDFDKDFGVGEWHGTNAFIRDGDRRTDRTNSPCHLARRTRNSSHGQPWQSPTLGGQRVTRFRELLFFLKKLLTRNLPLRR
jgi:predicted dithiol-disulfide oxidoreductase (DUF899 family)